MAMAIAGPGDDTKVVVCGPPDGIAGLLASRLTAAGGIRDVVLADETESLEQQVGKSAGAFAGGGEEERGWWKVVYICGLGLVDGIDW